MSAFVIGRVQGGEVSWLDDHGLVEPVQVSSRQWDILRFIARYQRETGETPSYDEIAYAVHLAGPSPVAYQVRQLIAKGLISRPPGRRRALQLNVQM